MHTAEQTIQQQLEALQLAQAAAASAATNTAGAAPDRPVRPPAAIPKPRIERGKRFNVREAMGIEKNMYDDILVRKSDHMS